MQAETANDGWCDKEFGWGPFVEAIFGIPSLIKLSKEPFVNPASSWTFSLRLGLSALALFCAMLIGMFAEPESPSNTWAQSLTAAGWLLSILMLVTGYLRAHPQLFLLRFWWLTQFVSGVVVFANHSKLNPSFGAHIVRGVSLLCTALLACLSFISNDVPQYKEIVAPIPLSASSSLTSFRSPNNGNGSASQLVTSPLLLPRENGNGISSAGNVEGPRKRYGLPSQLSQMTLYGADTSVFKGAISAWEEAVTSSYKQPNAMDTIGDEVDGEDESKGNAPRTQ